MLEITIMKRMTAIIAPITNGIIFPPVLLM
jgi:hypothetical protein